MNKSEWRAKMVDELKSTEINNTWELVQLPKNKSNRCEVGVQAEIGPRGKNSQAQG